MTDNRSVVNQCEADWQGEISVAGQDISVQVEVMSKAFALALKQNLRLEECNYLRVPNWWAHVPIGLEITLIKDDVSSLYVSC